MHDQPEREGLPPAVLTAATAVEAALAAFWRAALAECGWPTDRPPPSALRLHWTPGEPAAACAERAYRALQAAAAQRGTLLPGRVFCYQCGAADCAHAVPETPGQVFAGYANTGRPQWQELFNYLLALGDERAALLYGDTPPFVTRLLSRRRLIAEQFLAFGRDSLSYRILGQLVAGYVPLAGERYALSVQVVETADHRLTVQLLAAPRLHEALLEAAGGPAATLDRLHRGLRGLRQDVATLEALWRPCQDADERGKLLLQLFSHLRRLAAAIERRGRQDRRRTPHAEERLGQQRPVHKASDDLASAAPADFFRDRKTQTVVVAGKRGRVHVFGRDGRHITTLPLPRDQFERRVARARYVPLPPADLAAFRATLARTAAE